MALTPPEMASLLLELRSGILAGHWPSSEQLDALQTIAAALDSARYPAKTGHGRHAGQVSYSPRGQMTHTIADYDSALTSCCGIPVEALPPRDLATRQTHMCTCPGKGALGAPIVPEPGHFLGRPLWGQTVLDAPGRPFTPTVGTHSLVASPSTGDPMCVCGWTPIPDDKVKTALDAASAVRTHLGIEARK